MFYRYPLPFFLKHQLQQQRAQKKKKKIEVVEKLNKLFTFHPMKCLRSYPGESTRSHLNSEVKHLWARLVEWWVTTFESLVLKTFFFSLK